MKNFNDLELGFNDANNYKQRENKELLNKFFYQDEQLEHLLKPTTYFLLGDKGTGKTAYSVYLANNEYKNFNCSINDIHETEYVKFIKLKKNHKLILSDYTNVWKVLLLILLSKQLDKGEDWFSILRNYHDFANINNAIDQYYNNAFSPEIEKVIDIIEDYQTSFSIFGKIYNCFGCSTEIETNINYNEGTLKNDKNVNFQTNLLILEKCFKSAIGRLKLSKNHILFIDGIDLRPQNISYDEYLDCVKGLANAIWQLNTSFFANIKDSKGRIRVILLLRPDIFAQLSLHNSNNIVQDNSVLLDWKTNYPRYRESSIFKIADRILSVQQLTQIALGESWDYYFPFRKKVSDDKIDESFILFLRYSTFRPREIISMMKIMQTYSKKYYKEKSLPLNLDDFLSNEVQEYYSMYLLGEIKDYLAFYHTEDDYEIFLTFFKFLKGRTEFDYEYFIEAYKIFNKFILTQGKVLPKQFENSGSFLQFLYDMNVICYIIPSEDKKDNFFHWSYRDKNYSNVNPKIDPFGTVFRIHYGLQKALNLGKNTK